MSKSTKKNSPRKGRPPVYTGKVKSHILSLIRKHGLTHARRILMAETDTLLADERNLKIVPNALSISMPTLSKFADEAGIERKMGRPDTKLTEKRAKFFDAEAA